MTGFPHSWINLLGPTEASFENPRRRPFEPPVPILQSLPRPPVFLRVSEALWCGKLPKRCRKWFRQAPNGPATCCLLVGRGAVLWMDKLLHNLAAGLSQYSGGQLPPLFVPPVCPLNPNTKQLMFVFLFFLEVWEGACKGNPR